ncbi:MAG: hypothetical protein ACK5YR_18570 [Pirellula sp.]|jgi:hypothetical protein
MSVSSDDVKLGSLGQAARGKQLNLARGILIVVGILSLAANGFFFVTAQSRVNDEVNKLQQQGLQVDQSLVAGAVLENQIINGVGASIGIIFVVLGILVYQFPVPCTVGGLVLYVAANIGFGLLDPSTLASGIVIKVFIIIGLFKSVQSAFAYNAEKQTTTASNAGSGDNPFS